MKHIFFILSLVIGLNLVHAQIEDPVSWEFSTEVVGNETYLVSKATIDKGWHLYSQYLESEDGPIATEITYTSSPAYKLIGKNEEKSKIYKEFDPNFEMNLKFFKNEAVFKQKIENLASTNHTITATVYYMVCNEEKCLPPSEEEFKITVTPSKKGAVKLIPSDGSKTESIISEPVEEIIPEKKKDKSKGVLDPVDWSFYVKHIKNGKFEVIAQATIEKGWHVYATKLSTNDGPVATDFTINDGTVYSVSKDVIQEGTVISKFDKNFDAQLEYFENNLALKKSIELTSGSDINPSDKIIKGSIYFMVCNEEMCLPPEEITFELALTDTTPPTITNNNLDSNDNSIQSKLLPSLPKFDLDNPVNDCGGKSDIASNSLWVLFLLGLGGGLFSILTPCVYPMIPLTVSFFTKGGKEKSNGLFKAGLYGLFIALIYISLSIPFHVSNLDPQVLNGIATSPILNIVFFLVFVFFAFSFLGYYELTLPSKWSNSSDQASNKGGVIGIFFMALTLALVSFSCTGPILGSVLAGVLKDGAWPLTVALAGFGIALGLPFAIFAAFPSLMKSLPQSGGWLNSVKVTLGFLELALALKFLSNADLVEQWGFLKREVFFGIWILLGLGLGAYYLNLIRFPHDTPKRKLTFPKISLAVLVIAFVIYLIPGVTCGDDANRRLVSGFPPPLFYSYCNDGGKCPLNLSCYKDFEEGREASLEQGKPILLDFTGWACVSCREVEENIWPEKEVYELISEDYILISLYVDDKRELPKNEQGIIPIKYDNGKVKNKKIKTVGDKWSTFETLSFKNNSQPRYALLSPDGQLLNNPISYKDIKENGYAKYYAEFLECGLEAYEKIKKN